LASHSVRGDSAAWASSRAGGITRYTLGGMKTAVSIPQDIYEAADRTAKRLGISRSQLYAQAVAAFIAEQGDDEITAKLNELADELGSIRTHSTGRDLIDRGDWEW